MWYQIFAYFRFLWKSTNQHGVHSPFVYDLVTKCFYDKKKFHAYPIINQYRKDLLQNDSIIEVKDFGAGSRVFSSNKRKVSAIAKNAGITQKRAHLLYRLTHYLKLKKSLEIGTSLGLASNALHNNINELITIEGCPETAKVAQAQFDKYEMEETKLIIGEFKTELPKLVDTSYDLVYFDGNHQKEATLSYFETLLKTAHNNTVFIFDDIHWSKDMTEAWETVKNHPKVTVTVDTFFWGFVFFRKEQVKEHFIIRV